MKVWNFENEEADDGRKHPLNIAIITWQRDGKELYHLLSKTASPYQVRMVVEKDFHIWGRTEDDIPVVSLGRAVQAYHQNDIDQFVMPSLEESVNRGIEEALLRFRVRSKDLLYAPVCVFRDKTLNEQQKLQRICVYEDREELETMEIHAADHCNLNCKNCSMFCGLVEQAIFPDFTETETGIRILKKYFHHIKKFRIIGGEPLLNKELHRYLDLIRDIYPYTDIRLISNGLLVHKMPDILIRTLRKNDVTFIVTQYPALADQMDGIHHFLNEHEIRHEITDPVWEFQKIYDASGCQNGEQNFKTCHWKKTCATMYGTSIAGCFVPFVIPCLSRAFHLDIPVTGMINLNETGLTAKKIREKMDRPHALCRYCAPNGIFVPWQKMDSRQGLCLEDWSI